MSNSIKGLPFNQIQKPKEVQSNDTKIDDRRYIPKQYQDVAKGLEQQFAELMINEMNKTMGEEDDAGPGMDYYKSLQNTERAKTLTEQNMLGLQDVILNQIYPKRMRNEVAFKHYEDMMGKKLNHNLPTLNKPEKSDTITIKRNDSSEAASKAIDGVLIQGDSE